MKTPSFLFKPIPASIFWGVSGGLSLILVSLISNKGLIQIIPYPLILISAILFLKYSGTPNKIFYKMFMTGFLTFIIMSIILAVYVLGFVNSTFTFEFNRLLFTLATIVGIGSVSSLLVSFIAKPVAQ